MGVFLFSPATRAVLIIQGGADRLDGFIQLVDTEGTFIDLFLREFSFIQCHIKSRIEFISVIPRFTDSGIFIPVSVSGCCSPAIGFMPAGSIPGRVVCLISHSCFLTE